MYIQKSNEIERGGIYRMTYAYIDILICSAQTVDRDHPWIVLRKPWIMAYSCHTAMSMLCIKFSPVQHANLTAPQHACLYTTAQLVITNSYNNSLGLIIVHNVLKKNI